MQSSGSQPTSSSGESAHTLANIVGTAIALVTLVLPLWVIAHYTPASPTLESPSVNKVNNH